MAKVFDLPPMRGKRLMVMSPAGGMAVHMADLCEKAGFEFADPGPEFYQELQEFSNAGIINFSNPLDMGDIYDPKMHAHIFYSILHNENVDGAIYVTQRPHMPREDAVFHRLFHTDISKETVGAIQSSGKPLAIGLFGPAATVAKIKQNLTIPIFNSPEETIAALKAQTDFYAKKRRFRFESRLPGDIHFESLNSWIEKTNGVVADETLEMLNYCGIPVAESHPALNPEEAVAWANKIGYPVVAKIISPDAIHKSETGGVILDLEDDDSVRRAFKKIKSNLYRYKNKAIFEGVRIMEMADEGVDMFIGGIADAAFGPVVFFGYGGVYVEVFKDVHSVLCPSNTDEIKEKVSRLKAFKLLQGIRAKSASDVAGFVDAIERVSHIMTRFPRIKELDINPLRIFDDKAGVVALDARIRLEKA
jgi:acetyltransferase